MMPDAKAPVNRIIPLSTVDGPGARTSIFLQGCNIACLYCHNPETQQICRRCGSCVDGCPEGALSRQGQDVVWEQEKCTGCNACIETCPHDSSPKIQWMSPEEVMQAIRPNLPFIRGITVSGGECMLYPAFITGLFTLAREAGLTCLIDSNGTVDLEKQPALMAVTDGVMLDVKAWDAAVYKALTGAASNATVKRNLDFLNRTGKLAEVRIVYMPGYVDAEAAVKGVAQVVGEQRRMLRLKLIAFRCHGVRGMAETARVPTRQEMDHLLKTAQQAGFANIQVV